MFWVFTNYI